MTPHTPTAPLSNEEQTRRNRLAATKLLGLVVFETMEECSQYTPGAQWVHGSEYYEAPVYWAVTTDEWIAYQAGNLDLADHELPQFHEDRAEALRLVQAIVNGPDRVNALDRMLMALMRTPFPPNMGAWHLHTIELMMLLETTPEQIRDACLRAIYVLK